jgi:hypothetical protein
MAHHSIWFRVGYALERARRDASPGKLRSLALRKGSPRGRPNDGPLRLARPGRAAADDERTTLDALLTAGAGTLAGRLLGLWRPRHRTGFLSLVKAGAAGAAAALLRELLAPLLHDEVPGPRLDEALADALLAGAARGLVYAAVVEPRLPGPALARGLAFGSVEYLASPWGGLSALLGREAPHRRFPLVSGLFEGYAPEEDTLMDHVAFAVALSLLYQAAVPEIDAPRSE